MTPETRMQGIHTREWRRCLGAPINRNSDMGVGKTGSFADGEFAVRFVTSVSGKN